MTIKEFAEAQKILEQIGLIEEGLNRLKLKVHLREKHIEEWESGKRRWIPLPKMFCRLIWDNDKENPIADAPIEGCERLEFNLDKECIDFIIKHEEEKINKLKKELEEI